MTVAYQALVTNDGELTSVHSHNLSAITGGFVIKGYFLISQAVTWDSTAGTTGTPAVDIQSVTATGVALGDIVLGISVDEDTVDCTITGTVTAANTVVLVANNNGNTTFNPGATNVKVLVADVT